MEDKEPNYGNKTIYKNSIWSLVFKIASSLVSFFSAPLLLYVLGEEKYGAWASLFSLVSWMYYCDIGIGGSMRNRVAASIAENDYKKARKYIGISYTTISIISLILFFLICLVTTCFDICAFFNICIQGENLNVCLLVALACACINFVMSLANNVLYATQRAASVGFFGVLAQVLFLGTIVAYAVTGINALVLIILGEGVCQLIKNIIQHIYAYREYPKLKATKSDVDWSYAKDIISLGVMMFISQIAALVLNTTDNLVISKYLGVADVTPYNFCYKYFNIINMAYVALITPLLSAYTMAYAKKDKSWIKRTLRKNILIFILFVVGTILATLIFIPFSKIWLQKDLHYEKSLIISMAIYTILLMFSHIFSSFITGAGKVKETTIMTIIVTVLNIPLSIFFAVNCKLGITGVILGTVVTAIMGIWVGPFVFFKVIKTIK